MRSKSAVNSSLVELARIFLRLGAIAFGGPAAHIAMFHQEFVEKRKWINAGRFVDLLGATSLIPGPNSTEMAIHIGFERAKWKGLLIAGICFIFPAYLMVTCLTWLYVESTEVGFVLFDWMLYGVKPVVIAVVLHAIRGMFGIAVRKPSQMMLAGVVLATYLLNWAFSLGINELVLLFAGGAYGLLSGFAGNGRHLGGFLGVGTLLSGGNLFAVSLVLIPAGFTMTSLFLVFLKTGSVLYGSGYVLVAFLEGDLVDRLGWLSQQQLLDAIAIGQVTPGPVFTTATSIGYMLGGVPGSAVATLGIFIPSFLFVAILNPVVYRIRENAVAASFLDGVNASAIALMAGVSLNIGQAAIVDFTTIFIIVIAAYLLIARAWSSTWLIPIGALLGIASKFFLS